MGFFKLLMPQSAKEKEDERRMIDSHMQFVAANSVFNEGVDLFNHGQYEEALTAFDKAISMDYHFGRVWVNKGITLSALGREEDALKAYDKAISCDPNYPFKEWCGKGCVLFDFGRYEEALTAFDKAISIYNAKSPSFPGHNYEEAWYEKGRTLSALGRKEEAIEAYDKARYSADAMYNQGLILFDLGKYKEAW